MKVGDKVIMNVFEDSDDLRFLEDMNLCLGREGIITDADGEFFEVEDWYWPKHALTLVL